MDRFVFTGLLHVFLSFAIMAFANFKVLYAKKKGCSMSQKGWDRVKFGEAVIKKLMQDHWISREVALKCIASFVKKYVPLEERDLIDDMVNRPEALLKVMAHIYIAKMEDNGESPYDVQKEIATS